MHMTTAQLNYQNGSKGIGVSTLLSIGTSYQISCLSIISSLKPSLSMVKIEKSSKNGDQLQYTHCVKSIRIRSYSGPYFPAFGLNTERYSVSLRIQPERRKMLCRITPKTDAFHEVYITTAQKDFSIICLICLKLLLIDFLSLLFFYTL